MHSTYKVFNFYKNDLGVLQTPTKGGDGWGGCRVPWPLNTEHLARVWRAVTPCLLSTAELEV